MDTPDLGAGGSEDDTPGLVTVEYVTAFALDPQPFVAAADSMKAFSAALRKMREGFDRDFLYGRGVCGARAYGGRYLERWKIRAVKKLKRRIRINVERAHEFTRAKRAKDRAWYFGADYDNGDQVGRHRYRRRYSRGRQRLEGRLDVVISKIERDVWVRTLIEDAARGQVLGVALGESLGRLSRPAAFAASSSFFGTLAIS